MILESIICGSGKPFVKLWCAKDLCMVYLPTIFQKNHTIYIYLPTIRYKHHMFENLICLPTVYQTNHMFTYSLPNKSATCW